MKVIVQDVAIVQQRGGLGDAGLARVGRAPSIISVSGVMPIAKIAPSDDSRIASRSRDRPRRPTVGMFRRIERPVARRDQQRARHLQQAPRQLGG
mgnify:CR=1 FL=1